MNERIIINPNSPVTCPDCSQEFPLLQGISQQLIERFEDEYEAQLGKERDEIEAKASEKAEKRLARKFEEQLADLTEQLAESKAESEKSIGKLSKVREEATAKAKQEFSGELDLLRQEIGEKEIKLEEFRKTEFLLRKEKMELEDQKNEFKLSMQRQLEEQKSALRTEISQEYQMVEAELRKKIDDAHKANEDLKRKLEQGSQQLQGEVLELKLEDMLTQTYALDQVVAVAKGVRGADVVQTVMLRSGTVAGKIIWETKRAENWSNKWIPKLKDDQQNTAGEIAVLVSTVFPADVNEPFIQYEGVWLVRPEFARPLADALRAILIEAARQKSVSSGKNEKIEALYDYICSPQFAQKVRAVMDAYTNMRKDLDSEKAAMQRLWKKREGQLERIASNVLGICGELQGLSTSNLPHLEDIAPLEFDTEES